MKQLGLVTFLFFSILSPLSANEGKTFYATCAACHGLNGEGNPAIKAPSLAGQHTWYLQRQLNNFSSDMRGTHDQDFAGQSMRPFAKSLTDNKKREQLLAYIESLPAHDAHPKKSGDLMNGSRYYQGKCGACHGSKAQGNEQFQAPKLTGLDADYLLRQMQHFKSGVRGSHVKDKYGRQMAMMTRNLTDKALHDIIYFIADQK